MTTVATRAVSTRNKIGLLLAPGPSGSWDDVALGGPVVRSFFSRADNDYRWFLWYHGRRSDADYGEGFSSGRIGVATSDDGLNWCRGTGPVIEDDLEGWVLEPSEDWWSFDTAHVGVGDVQLMSSRAPGQQGGVFWMFYYGGNQEVADCPQQKRAEKGGKTNLGVALSQDGLHWAKVEGEHHSGSVFDFGEDFDSHSMRAPQVIYHKPDEMRMYYTALSKLSGRRALAVATSKDGFNWEKLGVVMEGAGPCHVVRSPRDSPHVYTMFYEDVDEEDGKACIGVATSLDGLQWNRSPVPVLRASEDPEAWDGGGVGSPWALAMADDKWRLYYEGIDGETLRASGVGLALSSEDGYLNTYRRRGSSGESKTSS